MEMDFHERENKTRDLITILNLPSENFKLLVISNEIIKYLHSFCALHDFQPLKDSVKT